MKYQRKFFLAFTFFSYFFLYTIEVLAGGLHIHREDIKLNGYPPNRPFRVNQEIQMSYTAEDYSYSGGHREFEYFVFLIQPTNVIRRSVGKNAVNRKDDVIVIQSALKEEKSGFFYNGEVNGVSDKHLINRIKEFQRSIGFNKADGRIDPEGQTAKKLLSEKGKNFFAQLARDYSSNEEKMRPIRYRTFFNAPTKPGKYEIKYFRWPLFTNK